MSESDKLSRDFETLSGADKLGTLKNLAESWDIWLCTSGVDGPNRQWVLEMRHPNKPSLPPVEFKGSLSEVIKDAWIRAPSLLER